METNENTEHTAPETGLALTFEGQTYLREAGKWAGFLSIVGFIFCGLFLIIALFIGTIFSFLGQLSPAYAQLPTFVGVIVAIVLILFDLIYFFLSLYLYQFSSRIKKGIVFTDHFHLNQGMGKLKSFFKMTGIITIIFLSLYALEFIVVLIAGIASAHH
jgi:hypothetical protein